MRARVLGGLAALLVATATPAACQQSETLRLTLEEALGLASGSNPTLRQATNSAQLNSTEMRTTWVDQLLPSATLTLFNTDFQGNLQRRALDNFGNPIENPSAEWNYFSRTNHSLFLGWTFQGPSLFQAHRRQGLTNVDRDLAQLAALTDVQIGVQRLYVDALEQRELMRAEEELIDARRIDLDVSERLFSLGMKTRVDVLQAELEIEQQTLAFRQQASTYERAILSLRTAMGLTDARPIEIVDEDLPIFDPVDFDAGALVSRALEVNPTLRRSEVGIQAAALGVAEQKRAWWPEISMGVNVYRRAYEARGQALFDASLAGGLESNFYLAFSLPFLNGPFEKSVERQRAAIALSNQVESNRQERLELEEAVRGAVLDLRNQWESFRLSERSNVIAVEAQRLAGEEYRLGTRTFEELRSGFQQEADTRRQVIMARYGFVEALFTLEAAVGTSVRELIPTSAGAGGN